MISDIQRYITENRLIPHGTHVICAVSGGKDSVFLLHILQLLQADMDFTLTAAHFNHMLRGEEAERDALFVADLCQRLSISCHIGKGDVYTYAKQTGQGIEAAARELRYNFLLGLSDDALIATAHTADDNLETVLMHLTRGSGLHGLTGIPASRGRIIRPILQVSSEEILRYLQEHHIPHVEDSSNRSDYHFRNRIRNQIVPILKKENPNITYVVSKMCSQLAEDDQYLVECSEKAYAIVSPVENQLQIEKLILFPVSLQKRVLKLFLKAVPFTSSEHIESVISLCYSDSPSARISLPGSFLVQRQYNKLQLLKIEAGDIISPTPILFPIVGFVCFGRYSICVKETICVQNIFPNQMQIRKPLDSVLSIRTRLPGDRLHLSYGTKKVNRLMIDKKIPLTERPFIPILVDDSQPIAILPYYLDPKYVPALGECCYLITIHDSEA